MTTARTIGGFTPGEVVVAAMRTIARSGERISPRKMPTDELVNVTLIVEHPWALTLDLGLSNRGLNPYIGAVEALQLVGQVPAPDAVSKIKAMEPFSEGGIYHGSYGARVYGQLHRVVELLKADPNTRQAVLTIYDSTRDLDIDTPDVPCTLTVQFLVRADSGQVPRLCMRTSMRSNDAYLGLPYDLIQFIALQGAVAAALNLSMGWYAHTVGSLHLYLRDEGKAAKVLDVSADWVNEPLWHGNDIAEISARARSILRGEPVKSMSDFETSLIKAVQHG